MVDKSFCQIHCFTLFLKPIKLWQQCLKLVIKFAQVFSNLTKLVILEFDRWATLYYVLQNVTMFYMIIVKCHFTIGLDLKYL